MRKILLAIVLITTCKISLCQTVEDFNQGTFTLFPQIQRIESCFANVIPDSTYLYWRCIYNPGPVAPNEKERVVFETGDKKFARLTKRATGWRGFMTGCPPLPCSYYIMAVKPDKTVIKVNTSNTFKEFLGQIDNLDEVQLLIYDHNYVIRNDYIKSGSYQERKDDYLLYLGEWFSDLMSGSKTSTKAVLTKAGYFKIIESTNY
jgi:hypothetical protein